MTDPDFGGLLARWPGPEYHVTVPIRAPLDFAYRWCTHYSPEDPRIEGGAFERKVLLQRPDRAEFEDLEATDSGWAWSRSVVSFHPPRGWSLLERGNRVEAAATYLLTEQPDGRLRLDLRWRRKALVPSPTPAHEGGAREGFDRCMATLRSGPGARLSPGTPGPAGVASRSGIRRPPRA